MYGRGNGGRPTSECSAERVPIQTNNNTFRFDFDVVQASTAITIAPRDHAHASDFSNGNH
jgi:hypothetical protein